MFCAKTLLVPFLACLFPTAAKAGVILTVNLSNPAAATFTATAENSMITIGPISSADGITLSGFFSGNSATVNGSGFDISGTLDVLDSTTGTSRRGMLPKT